MQEEFEKQKEHITYGSVVAIAHASDLDAYLFANGFSRNNITVKNIDKLNNLKNPEDPSKSNEDQHFFSSVLFLITPIFSNNLKQDALGLVKKALEDNQMQNQESMIDHQMEEISLQKIIQMKSKVISEYKSNLEIFNKFKNKSITFNQSFQLIHLDSYKYLACYDQEAEHEKENFKLQLDEHPSEHSIFKITPAFKYQKDADQTVHEYETVLINHVNRSFLKEVFLHASEELSIIHKKKGHKEKFVEKKPQEEQKSGVLIREANASIDQKTFWKLHLFSSEFEEDSSFLQSGDIIWIYHSELNASLTARQKVESFQLFHLKKKNSAKAASEQQKSIAETPIEFIRNNTSEEKFEDFNAHTSGVWIIEAIDYKKGENIQYGENFRLKHLITGRYLTIKRDDTSKKLCLALQELNMKMQNEDFNQKNTSFSFFPISSLLTEDSSQQIPINSFTYIRNVNSKKWLDATVCQTWKEDGEGDFEVTVNPILKDNFTEQEIFRIRKAPIDLIWELKFSNSYYPTLKKFNDKLLKSNVFFYFVFLEIFKGLFWQKNLEKVEFEELVNVESRIEKMIKCIENLDNFCRNKIGNKTFDQKFGELNASRQNVRFLHFYILKLKIYSYCENNSISK